MSRLSPTQTSILEAASLRPTLRQYHDSEAQAASLIALGDLSSVTGEAVCAYHRDRGDSWGKTQPRTTNSHSALVALAKACGAQYLYLFKQDEWHSVNLYVADVTD